ncbi:hypothetical protein CORC01_02525 [Colletotrichum orchidophilum]|uniref:Uncharacterized protein n=1 Tax=Colletotrichum orchidophilum TaxID=1209926 RepID=A0A1G4BLN6_9PEZI|nr:uncharacterized protein CORC01_02525 [Colletotrichum orchidophilum]OHF02245.1 hypothetical protein CORC01_02525 [Colletotrichum orchidophilum]
MKLLLTTILASWATLGVSGATQERQVTQPLVDSASSQDQITKDNDIATANGGNGAFGLPGYCASVNSIWNRVSSAAGAIVWKQSGNRTCRPLLYGSPATPAEGITADLDVDGKIVLVREAL